MKKIAKVCAALSLCVGFTFSLAALSACGDGNMIDGDFTTEATAEQVTEVREYLSEASYDTALGDTSSEDWSYNARFYADGNIDLSMSATGTEDGTPVNYLLNTDTDVRFDHIMTFYGSPELPSLRGSGQMNYDLAVEMTNPVPTQISAETVTITQQIDGACYNDAEYFYIDGSVGMSSFGAESTYSGKFRTGFYDLFGSLVLTEGSGFTDLSPILEALDQAGAAIFVDDSETFKVKISLGAESWVALSDEELSEITAETGVSIEEILENTNFRRYDLYLEFDKDSGLLLGYGSVADVSADFTMQVEGVEVSVAFDIDYESWFLHSDRAADELPADLSEYTDISMDL